MKKFWIALSAACFAGAVLALWRQHVDAAFVVATVGALAWFLHYRSRLKELIAEPEVRINDDRESDQTNEN
jgi:hypothetical protein